MRNCWLVLIVLLLSGCGQPLQLNSPGAQRTARPASASAQPPSAVAITPADSSSTATVPANEPTQLASVEPQPSALATQVTNLTPLPSVVVIPQTAVPLTSEQRWRAQELERKPFESERLYIANESVPLLWYDPLTSQVLEIGTIQGEFPAQAQFILQSNQRPALEVRYQINQGFGLTAISEAVRERMRAAGYTESVEAYIELTDGIVPKQ